MFERYEVGKNIFLKGGMNYEPKANHLPVGSFGTVGQLREKERFRCLCF
jgi:hypothetical protein